MKLHLALTALLASMARAEIVTLTGEAADTMAFEFVYEADIIPFNAVVTGHPDCAGLFAGGSDAVPLPDFPDRGLVLSTGKAASLHKQENERTTAWFNTPGDDDIDAMNEALGSPHASIDACVLEFDFYCFNDKKDKPCNIEFKYVFGSEEYVEYIGSNFNDVFAFFLNGVNIATIDSVPNGIPVSVNSVNDQVNGGLFVNNDPDVHGGYDTVPFPLMEADGFTIPLTARGKAAAGIEEGAPPNHMKFVIADIKDAMLDSWVLLESNTFKIPPGPGGGGDPHFRRWGQRTRDTFHGECDLVVAQSEKIDFHIRTTLFNNLYSFIESAALRIGEDKLEISRGEFTLNGKSYGGDELPLTFGANKFYQHDVERRNGKVIRRNYRLAMEDGSEIEFKFYKHYLTFELIGNPEWDGAQGLLGSFPSGDLVSREGKTLETYEEHGFEWQVGPNDPKLFSELRAPQLPEEKCRMPTGSTKESRRRLRGSNVELYKRALKACAGREGSDVGLCIDDVLQTGDIELAHEWN